MIGLDTTFLVAAVHKEHPRHGEASNLLDQWFDSDDQLALCAHVVAEFLHVVTDERRFQFPLSMQEALDHCDKWMSADSCEWIETTAEIAVIATELIEQHRLWRKRILDTFIAATYADADVDQLATLNPADFRIFAVFEFLPTPSS